MNESRNSDLSAGSFLGLAVLVVVVIGAFVFVAGSRKKETPLPVGFEGLGPVSTADAPEEGPQPAEPQRAEVPLLANGEPDLLAVPGDLVSGKKADYLVTSLAIEFTSPFDDPPQIVPVSELAGVAQGNNAGKVLLLHRDGTRFEVTREFWESLPKVVKYTIDYENGKGTGGHADPRRNLPPLAAQPD